MSPASRIDGLKVSTTCEGSPSARRSHRLPSATFVDGHRADVQGHRYARMMVGSKGHRDAEHRLPERWTTRRTWLQGADLTQMSRQDRTAGLDHPPPGRASLLDAAEELRRGHACAGHVHRDVAGQGRPGASDRRRGRMAERINDLLLPIVKGWVLSARTRCWRSRCRRWAVRATCRTTRSEQYIRDAKIDTLYEGTTAIQGLDFFFRKMVRDQFQAITKVAAEITETVKNTSDGDQLAAERRLLGKARRCAGPDRLAGRAGRWKSQKDLPEIYKVRLNTTRLLMAVGDLIIGWLLLRCRGRDGGARPARRPRMRSSLQRGRSGCRKWFAQNRLPLLAGELLAAKTTNLEIMELSEGRLRISRSQHPAAE